MHPSGFQAWVTDTHVNPSYAGSRAAGLVQLRRPEPRTMPLQLALHAAVMAGCVCRWLSLATWGPPASTPRGDPVNAESSVGGAAGGAGPCPPTPLPGALCSVGGSVSENRPGNSVAASTLAQSKRSTGSQQVQQLRPGSVPHRGAAEAFRAPAPTAPAVAGRWEPPSRPRAECRANTVAPVPALLTLRKEANRAQGYTASPRGGQGGRGGSPGRGRVRWGQSLRRGPCEAPEELPVTATQQRAGACCPWAGHLVGRFER